MFPETQIRIPVTVKPLTKIRFISLEDINTAAKEANKITHDYFELEASLINRGMFQRRGSMMSLHQAFFGEFDPVQFRLTKGGFINLVTTIIIMKK